MVDANDVDESNRKYNDENYVHYNCLVTFSEKQYEDIILKVSEEIDISLLFNLIRTKIPSKMNHYIIMKFSGKDKKIIVVDESTEKNLILSNHFDNHISVENAKKSNPNLSEFKIELEITFISKKNYKIIVISNKIDSDNKEKLNKLAKNLMNKNYFKKIVSNMTVIFNEKYQSIEKNEDDYLVLITNEAFMHDIIKFELQKADKIFIWGKGINCIKLQNENKEKVKLIFENIEKLTESILKI